MGLPTLRDVHAALRDPGRDPRQQLGQPAPPLRSELLSLEALRVGQRLQGTVLARHAAPSPPLARNASAHSQRTSHPAPQLALGLGRSVPSPRPAPLPSPLLVDLEGKAALPLYI